MATFFTLWVECIDAESLDSFDSHFSGLTHDLFTGRTITWKSETGGTPTSIEFRSGELSSMGIRTVQDAIETTEAGLRLYHHLLSAPDFRFARLAWEAWTVPMEELGGYIEKSDDGSNLPIQCVIDNALWEQLSRPRNMRPFRPGYYWSRYRGETYHPLGSNDHPELFRLNHELLPR